MPLRRLQVHRALDMKFIGAHIVVACGLFQLSSAHASCSDRPETPNQAKAVAVSATQIHYSWRVATRENPIYYDIYVRGSNNQDVGKNRTGDGPHRQASSL
jgi:hypothetical protein